MNKFYFGRLMALPLIALLAGCLRPPPATVAEAESIRSLQMLEAGVRWNWSGGRLLRTANGGRTWTDVTPPGYVEAALGKTESELWGEYYFDAQFALISAYGYQQNFCGLWRTTDGGKTWLFSKIDEPLEDFHFIDSSHGWAMTSEVGAGSSYVRYYQTGDGGATWTPVRIIQRGGEDDPGSPPQEIQLVNLGGEGLTFFPPEKIFNTDGNTIDDEKPKGTVHLSLSTNLGKTWRNLDLPLPPGKYHDDFFYTDGLAFFDTQHGLLSVNMFVYKPDGSWTSTALVFFATDDGGETWTMSAEAGQDLLNPRGSSSLDRVMIVSAKEIKVLAGARLGVTHDGGKTWQSIQPQFDPPLAASDPDRWEINFLDATHGTNMIYDEQGNHTLYQTADGGATWVNFPLPKVN